MFERWKRFEGSTTPLEWFLPWGTMKMDRRKNVLILCTRNSARSQMAEALLRKHAGDRFNVYSAGLNPDRIHPMVEPVMREIGLDVSGQQSKGVKEYLGRLTAHYLIVVCERGEKLPEDISRAGRAAVLAFRRSGGRGRDRGGATGGVPASTRPDRRSAARVAARSARRGRQENSAW